MAEDTKIRGRKQAKGSKNIRRKLTELVRSKRQSGRQDNAENKTRGVIKAFTRSIFIILAPVIMPAIIVMMGIVAILVAFAGKSGIKRLDSCFVQLSNLFLLTKKVMEILYFSVKAVKYAQTEENNCCII